MEHQAYTNTPQQQYLHRVTPPAAATTTTTTPPTTTTSSITTISTKSRRYLRVAIWSLPSNRVQKGEMRIGSGQPAGKMGGAMWLWALGQQTERIKSLRPSLLLNPRLYCYYKH
jgi:hypothetical protein